MIGIVAQNDELGQRICILFEFLQGKPVFESYKNLCNKIGDEAIEYKEFDFWFYRFANGKLDLNYDKSLEPETRSFSDIPVEIIGNIVDYLNPIDRFILRKVNRNLRTLIDGRHKTVKISFDDTHVELELSNQKIKYVKTNEHCKIECEGNEKIVEGDFLEIALNDLTCVLKIPELRLDKLNIVVKDSKVKTEVLEKFFEGLETFLKSLDHQLTVKSSITLAVRLKHVMAVLPYLKPETLHTISIGSRAANEEEEEVALGRLFQLDQWKKTTAASIYVPYNLPVGALTHLWTAALLPNSITERHIHQVQEIFLKSTSMQFIRLGPLLPVNIAEIEKAIGPRDSGINKFLKIQISEKWIDFRRKF